MSKATNVTKLLTEAVATNAATAFLTEYFGGESFIGPDIENIVAQSAQIVYQDINDSNFSGALVTYHEKTFVILNTHQSLRIRYYAAAHELWHLALAASLFGQESSQFKELAKSPGFDEERAADHFAAEVMLPRDAVTRSWRKYVERVTEIGAKATYQAAVIRIANRSSMPYEAVCRRLKELHLLSKESFVGWDETQWLAYLAESGFPPSPLDTTMPFQSFSGLASLVAKLVDKKQMTPMEAANYLSATEPVRANRYLKEHEKETATTLGDEG